MEISKKDEALAMQALCLALEVHGGLISTTWIQKNFRLSYVQAAYLMEWLIEKGYVIDNGSNGLKSYQAVLE